MAVEVRIPSLGESVSQGVIARWLKENGEAVAVDDALFELETDKATMEIPAEAAGRLEILKAAGETVEVGTIVARIADGAGAAAAKPKPAAPAPAAAPSPPAESEEKEDVQLSPAVRKLLVENRHRRGRGSRNGKGRTAHQRGRAQGDRGRQEDRGAGAVGAEAPRSACHGSSLRSGAARVRRSRRRARRDDASSQAHRRAAGRGTAYGGHPHHLQRNRHVGGDRAPQALQGALREGARRRARLHVALRASVHSSPSRAADRQRLDRR